MMRIANWYGEQAAQSYQRWANTADERDLRDYVRFVGVASRMWKVLARVQHRGNQCVDL